MIWRPSEEVREGSNAMRLARRLGFDDYWELVRFSSEEPERFWPEAIADMGRELSRPCPARQPVVSVCSRRRDGAVRTR